MSVREKCISLLDCFNENQLQELAALLQAAAEAEDDAFCRKLLYEYACSSEDDEVVSEEALLKELGIDL